MKDSTKRARSNEQCDGAVHPPPTSAPPEPNQVIEHRHRKCHRVEAIQGALALELKHGSLALIDSMMPVVANAPNDDLLEKLKSNLQEVRARGGKLYVVADLDSRVSAGDGLHVIRVGEHAGLLSPIVHVVPLQLLAYHAAVLRGQALTMQPALSDASPSAHYR